MNAKQQVGPKQDQIQLRRLADHSLVLQLSGNWRMQDGLPSFYGVQKQIESESGIQLLSFDTQSLSSWDSGFVTFLLKILDFCSRYDIEVDRSRLPEGVQRLLNLATAVPEQKGARRISYE